jgi:hypothetical protein
VVATRLDERRLGNLLAQNVAFNEVRQPDLGLVLEERGCRNGKDLYMSLLDYVS